MMSDLGWLTYDNAESRYFKKVFRHFSEKDTVDELGLGGIRDSISDNMFPGTSVSQTKVRYMLFIPWLFMILEEKFFKQVKDIKNLPSELFIREQAKDLEVSLIQSLKRGTNEKGVVGRNKEGNLDQFPSVIFWSGIKSWKIFNDTNATDDLVSLICKHYHDKLKFSINSEEENTAKKNVKKENVFWCENIPKMPKELLIKITLKLTKKEAKFLKNQLNYHHGETLLAQLVNLNEEFNCEYVWDIPRKTRLKPKILELIHHGEKFSFVMNGASILYNLQLSKRIQHSDKTTDHLNLLNEWHDEFNRTEKYKTWKIEKFWRDIYHPKHSFGKGKFFVEKWFEILQKNHHNLENCDSAIELITHHEELVKGKKYARLSNSDALARWNGEPRMSKYDFRWHRVKGHINDIYRALQ